MQNLWRVAFKMSAKITACATLQCNLNFRHIWKQIQTFCSIKQFSTVIPLQGIEQGKPDSWQKERAPE